MTSSQQPSVLDLDRLERALARANVPVLLVVLYQLTGDRRWLGERFRPTRAKGMDENRDGGLDGAAQAEVRAAAAEAIGRWAAGEEPVLPLLRGAELVEVLSFMNGEDVPPEYEAMMSEVVAVRGDAPSPAAVAEPAERAADFSVLVVGAGVSGMLASLRLREAGIDHVVIEKNDEVGGGWWENTYPGCGVDTPSYLYSYSFFPRDWETFFGRRDEVQGYLEDFASTYGLRDHVQFGSEVVSLRWDEERAVWTAAVRRADGRVDQVTANAVFSAVGVLNRPKVPELPGMDSFTGPLFHSAQWPQGLDLTGKRVAVVGAGASAMQIVPAIAGAVASLTVFQRSPQWIAPNADYFEPVDPSVHWLMRHVPFYAGWYRAKLSWIFNDRVHPTLKVDPEWSGQNGTINAANDGHRRFYTRYIHEQLGDRTDLIEKSLPDYPPFGKRMLLDNGWYATLRLPHVELVTEGVASFTPTTVVDTAGDEHEVDVVILATGFLSTQYLFPIEVTGRDGTTLEDLWHTDEARAYLGITVPKLPNLFLLCGPNTGLGHGGSFITIVEWQVRYAVEAIELLLARGTRAMECRDEAYQQYARELDAAHAQLVWTDDRMTNWYRNGAGRVVAVMPWRIVDYHAMTRHVDPTDYAFT